MLLPEEPGELAAGGSCAEVVGVVAPALTVREPAGASAGPTEGVLEPVVLEGLGANSSATSRDASTDMVEGRGWFLQNCTDGTLYR